MINKKKILTPFIVFFLITLIFYGRIFFTWFQQDEWSLFGRLYYLNSLKPGPGINSFLWGLFPHPRYTFAPIHFGTFSLLNFVFGINFFPYALLSILTHTLNAFMIFLLVKNLSKNIKVAFLAGLIFSFYSIGQKSVTWILSAMNIGWATFFSILSLICFLDSFKNRLSIIKAILFLLVALWFSEQALVMFIVFSAITLINRKSLKPLWYMILFILVYMVTRLLLSKIGAQIHQDFIKLPEPLILKEYLTIIAWAPIRSLVDIFFTQSTIYQLSNLITPILRPDFSAIKNTTQFDLFGQTSAVDFITIILLPPTVFLLFRFYKLIKIKTNKRLFRVGMAFIMASSLIPLLLTIRGRAAIGIYIMRSRDLYMATIGASIIFSLIFNTLWNRSKYYLQKTVIILLFLLFAYYHWGYINRFVLAGEIQKAKLRKPIVEQIYSLYPTLPKKVIFYALSNTPYYGSATPNLPFQTGLGRTLLVWYIYKNNSLPPEFVKDDFLYLPGSEGYKEIGEYGFGYFTDFNKMQVAIKDNNLKPETVFAFSWFGEIPLLKDITFEIRSRF